MALLKPSLSHCLKGLVGILKTFAFFLILSGILWKMLTFDPQFSYFLVYCMYILLECILKNLIHFAYSLCFIYKNLHDTLSMLAEFYIDLEMSYSDSKIVLCNRNKQSVVCLGPYQTYLMNRFCKNC